MPLVPKSRLSRFGGWLPSSVVLGSYIKCHTDRAAERYARYRAGHPDIPKGVPLSSCAEGPHVPSVQAFADAINADPVMRGLFDKIFLQVSPLNQVPNFDRLLFMLDGVVIQPPSYHIATYPDGEEIGEPIGVPIYLIFDILSNTSAAHDLFRMDQFNVAMKQLLDSWGTYLADPNPPAPLPPSNSSLNDGPEGWFSPTALKSLETNLGDLTFDETYDCPDPDAVNRGFATWDAFFTRNFSSDKLRPIIDSGGNTFIYNACESTVYRKAENVQLHDQFWLKAQKYSLHDMLDGHAYAEQFVGGTVYQAFLSPSDYHRWHSPVNGTVVDTFVVPGTYYAVLPDSGAEADDPNLKPGDPHGGLIRSQGWLTVAAARAVIFIQADDPIGLMCFMGVGMCEVSTCQLSVKEGDPVKIGQELGMFHFGGSSNTLIFRPSIKITWAEGVEKDRHRWINSVLGLVTAL
ncbi:hypothetical protein BS17DRAFT_879256 [Gyrodon lividus]|nr:hypothetical protein BS17DRAFT_879256 [Gyrodon lividus]